MAPSYTEDHTGPPIDPNDLFTSTLNNLSNENALTQPSSLNVSQPGSVMRSIVEIFELEEEPQSEDVEMGDDENEPGVDLEDQRRRTERLRTVVPALTQLWWSGSEEIDLVAEKLGDGSRDRTLRPFPETLFITSPNFLSHIWTRVAESMSKLPPQRPSCFESFLRLLS